MRLRETQEKFAALMLNAPEVLERPPAGVFSEGGIALPRRLAVYRNNIVGTLTDTLVASFPLLKQLVGQAFLEGMARGFILKNPPREGSLNTYGADFDAFVAGFAPARDLPYLPDVARLEHAMTCAYYAPNDAALAPEMLRKIPEDGLPDACVSLRASAQLLDSPWPLLAIWDFCAQDDPQTTLDLDQPGGPLLVLRPALETLIAPLGAGEYAALRALQGGDTLGGAVTAALARDPEFNIGVFLNRHIDLETFSAPQAKAWA